MSNTFIPVDLDQVLDEFEEQEKNHQGSPPLSRPDSLNLPSSFQDLKPHSISDPRTYSFNSPLEAILNDHSKNTEKTRQKSLAEELADLDLGAHAQYIDDDDGHDDDDDDDAIDGGSDASSTAAIIAAAEKITRDNDFRMQSTSGVSDGNNFDGTKDLDKSNLIATNREQSAKTISNEVDVDESDFLSLLNSVVDESPFCLKDTKSTSGSINLPAELSNEVKHSSFLESSEDASYLLNITNDSTQNYSDNYGENSDTLNGAGSTLSNYNDVEIAFCDNRSINRELVTVGNENTEIQPKVDSCANPESNESNFSSQVETNWEDAQASCNATVFDAAALQVDSEYIKTQASNNMNETPLPVHDTAQENILLQIDSINEDIDSQQIDEGVDTNDEFTGSFNTFNEGECSKGLSAPIDSTPQASSDLHSAEHDDFTHNEDDDFTHNEDECSKGLPAPIDSTPQANSDLHSAEHDDFTQNEGQGSAGMSVATDISPQASSDSYSTEHDDFNAQACNNDVPLLQTQVIITTVHDSSSAESLCGDESSGNDNLQAALPEDGQGSPARTISPEPQLDEGILPVHISSGDPEMGFVPPIWVPDEVATHCMTCGVKFSMIKRKHHCRACGRVLCSSCCNMKFPLPYMGNKDARVCQVCCDILIQGSQQQELTEGLVEEIASNHDDPSDPVISNNSDDIPVEEDMPTVMATEQPEAPAEQVLESTEDIHDSLLEDDLDIEDVTAAGPSDVVTPPVLTLPTEAALLTNGSSASLTSAPLSPALSDDSDLSFRLDVEHVRAMIPQDSFTLPPVLNLKKKAIHIQEHPDPAEIMYRLKGLGDTVIFLLNKNLIVKVKIVKLKCCAKKKCWCFVTDGMGAANQEEMVVLLECEHSENTVPKDVLSHFNTAFTYAKQGHVVSDLGFTIFGQPFLGSSNNAGFLYIKPTFQCLENLPLPAIPYVVGILIQRQEAPWAQLFPIRLMLRLGTEFRYYPCPLWSVRNRPSVYHDIGHTIMNLLTDFKNFQYSIPRITGLVIHMENTKTTVRLPQDRFDEMLKVLNAAEEHMFAFGANFSSEADSHLVCLQEGGNYKTQAINIQNKARKVTGASFVVFTGSLKTSNPNDAKVSIIEDGIMIQMLPDAILELRKALREMQDYLITTGSNATANAVTHVNVEWVSRDTNKQTYISPIDGRSLTDVPSIQVHSSCDFSKRDIYRIRWTNVFLERNGSNSRGLSSRGLTRLTGELARACCEALKPYLQGLFDMDLTRLSLRVNVDADSVEYSIGANQKPLPANLMADLDNALIPSINAAAMKYRRGPLTVELFFSVISLF